MKVLIACDGSAFSDVAIDEMAHAGLPAQGSVMVVTVAEVWLPPPEQRDGSDKFVEELLRRHREKGNRLLREASAIADLAAKRVCRVLPGWKVETESTYGSPAWSILTASDKFSPDLIVVGSHGESAIERLVLGSVSQKVLTEADCSVRVAREGKHILDSHDLRLIIGYDGLSGAEAAVESVAARSWPKNTQIRLVIVTDPADQPLMERLIAPFGHEADIETEIQHKWISALAHEASRKLIDAGLNVSTVLLAGKPHDVLLREALEWDSDCIFLGANAYGSRLERFLLGSTSSAVAARAHCTVEVARRRK